MFIALPCLIVQPKDGEAWKRRQKGSICSDEYYLYVQGDVICSVPYKGRGQR